MSGSGVASSLFRLLLYASPAQFRREYAAQIGSDFKEGLLDEAHLHGPLAGTGFALRAYADILAAGLYEHGAMILRDFAYAARSLRKTPLFAFVVIATLALAIGANATAFSILRAVILAPLPYAQPGRLVAVDALGHGTRGPFSLPNFADVKRGAAALQDAAAYTNEGGGATMTGRGLPLHLSGYATTPTFFDVLGVHPEIGRFFRALTPCPACTRS